MLEKIMLFFSNCWIIMKCPNFSPIIWIILSLEFMRNIVLAGFSTTILTMTMEILELHFIHFIAIVHGSMFTRGFFYLVGGWIADSYIGNYYVYIASFVVICCIINPTQCIAVLLNTLLTIEQKRIIFIVSIFIYNMASFGMGCAIPLYSEQFFLPEEEKELRSFYIITFWLNNFSFLIGATISLMILRDVTAFNDSYISLPFLICVFSDSIYLAIILKFKNKFLFRNIKHKVVEQQIHLNFHAILTMCTIRRLPDERRRATLDYAVDLYDRNTIKIAKRMCYLVPLILSFLTYWITRAQIHTVWVMQATCLKGEYYFYYLPPQDIVLLNTIFNLILIPIVYLFIIPLRRIWSAYLKWIGIGFIFMFISSCFSSLLQEAVEDQGTPIPYGVAQVRFYNSLPIPIFIQCNWTGNFTLDAYETEAFFYLKANNEQKPIYIETDEYSNWTDYIQAVRDKSISYVVKRNKIVRIKGNDPVREHFRMHPVVFFLCGDELCSDNIIKLNSKTNLWNRTKKSPNEDERTLFKLRFPGTYSIYLNNSKKLTTFFKNGGTYSVLIYNNNSSVIMRVFEVVKPNSVALYWIVPQFFFSALGDTFAWVPMHAFVYTQSPPDLRAMTRAFHLLGLTSGSGILASSVFFHYSFTYIITYFTLTSFVFLIIYLILSSHYRPKIISDK